MSRCESGIFSVVGFSVFSSDPEGGCWLVCWGGPVWVDLEAVPETQVTKRDIGMRGQHIRHGPRSCRSDDDNV